MLVGGIFFIASQVNKKQEVNPVVTKIPSGSETKKQELSKDGDENVIVFTGNVVEIAENY